MQIALEISHISYGFVFNHLCCILMLMYGVMDSSKLARKSQDE